MENHQRVIIVERDAVRDRDPNTGIVRLVDGRELPVSIVRTIPTVINSCDSSGPLFEVEPCDKLYREMAIDNGAYPFVDRPA